MILRKKDYSKRSSLFSYLIFEYNCIIILKNSTEILAKRGYGYAPIRRN